LCQKITTLRPLGPPLVGKMVPIEGFIE